MTRIALGIEYEGTSFFGWQKQNEVATLQSTLEHAISKIVDQPVEVVCAGRTDARVHALGQVVHFDTPVPRPIEAWLRGINSYLPKTIRVKWATPVTSEFHARYSALARRYLYFVQTSSVSPGHFRNGVTWVHYPLNPKWMRLAANDWLGEHDFSSFRASDCQSKTPVRTIYDFTIHELGNLLIFDVTANAFLHHMIRNMVGTLLPIGRGVMAIEDAKKILLAKDRTQAPQMAPPDGLYLLHVHYPEHFGLDNKLNMPWFLQASNLVNKLDNIYRCATIETTD